MDNNKPKLWDKNSEVRALRQPKPISDTVERQDNVRQIRNISDSNINNRDSRTLFEIPARLSELTIGNNESKREEIIAKSTLKADAPEWYPPGCTQNTYNIHSTSTSTIQDRLKFHKKSQVNDKQSLNIAGKSNSSWQNQYYNAYEESPDIIRIKQIINTLTKDPGQFDNLLGLFMETLLPYFDDIIALSIIAQVLVEQAINESNFRYTGARLCWFVEQNCPGFRAELHLKCKKQLEDNVNKQNVLLFIAELYTQLPHLNVYGGLLVNSFKQLLVRGSNDNVKCICQALKLTGFSLEQSNKPDLDEVFEQLKLATKSVNGTVLSLVNSVINLRTSNWGYSNETTNNVDPVSDGFYYKDLQNTVFYNTDGHKFTSEERDFLAAHMDLNTEYLSDNSDPDDLCDPEPEMDEEIQAAFKEFVKFSKH